MRNPANILLEKHLTELGLTFTPEYRFHPARLWRLDYVLGEALKYGLTPAIEIDGGIWTGGRHTRGMGYQRDMDKLNAAAAAGFLVFRFSTRDVLQGRAKEFLRLHLKGALPRL